MIEVSIAAPEDQDDLLRLLKAQLQAQEVCPADENLERAISGALRDPSRGTFLLARDADRPVGVAYLSYVWTLEYGGKAAWLEELFVVPELRGQGLGVRLLDEALREAAHQGCGVVDLEVEEAHPRAESLYTREGFRRYRHRRWVKYL